MTTETDVFYVVQVMRHWNSLQVLGIPLDAEAAAPGCIGFLPVFKDAESARAWRTEHDHLDAGIAAIARGERR